MKKILIEDKEYEVSDDQAARLTGRPVGLVKFYLEYYNIKGKNVLKETK